MITYLFSNIKDTNIFDNEFSKLLQLDVVEANKITYIPSSIEEEIKSKKYAKFYSEYFMRCGFDFNNNVVLNEKMKQEEIIEHLNESNLIFLMGGRTLNQFNYLRDNDLFEILKNIKSPVLGLSAGAINLCSKALLTDEHETEPVFIYEGIGRVDISVEVHYDQNCKKQNKLLEIAKNEIEKIYCITDNSFIRISDEKIDIIGDPIFIK